jgi:hypothetical protein
MNTFFWIISLALLIIGLFVSVMNWVIFVQNYILKKKLTSAIPLLGGLSGAIGIACLPIAGSSQYLWIPLIADWGCLPVIIVSLISRVRGKEKI